jgi:2-polyprenyl-3-methyl-5-hydroxy-6-metoxy-1,4-benzoquinol methylase
VHGRYPVTPELSDDRTDFGELNDEAGQRWNALADWWDDQIGDGNAVQDELVEPAQEALLDLRPGERVLDIACGAGRFTRRMATKGVTILAFDQAENFIRRAIARSAEFTGSIEYRVMDATDWEALSSLGVGSFDAAVATMALMDIAALEPLAEALPRLLIPGGRFVFSVTHPAFNSGRSMLVGERSDTGETNFFVKVPEYTRSFPIEGVGIVGQPRKQYYFHRPISTLLNAFTERGLVVDRILEPAFQVGESGEDRLRIRWHNLVNIPHSLVVRLRRPD